MRHVIRALVQLRMQCLNASTTIYIVLVPWHYGVAYGAVEVMVRCSGWESTGDFDAFWLL